VVLARSELDLKRIVESFVEVCRHREMGVDANKRIIVVEREGSTV